MTGRFRRAGGILLALLVTGSVVALSHVPYRAGDEARSELRLSWRLQAPAIEECRRRTPEELAALPVHMRQETVCERELLPFRLAASLDGRPVVGREVRSEGRAGDRPLFIYEVLPLEPGRHRVSVSLRPLAEAGEQEHTPGQPHGDRGRLPPPLALDTILDFAAGEILVITADPAGRSLLVLPAAR